MYLTLTLPLRLFATVVFIGCTSYLGAQVSYKGVVADSITRRPLPFATLQADDITTNAITSINGRFEIKAPPDVKLRISYIGYRFQMIVLSSLNNDTIFLVPEAGVLGEVVVRSDEQKIRRIINTAVRNKERHNPDLYAQHQCRVYYKMNADLFGFENDSIPTQKRDTTSRKKRSHTNDSAYKAPPNLLSTERHLLFAETYSHRMYTRPQQVQEVVLASRFSGLQKTWFHNVVTDVLPFHVYTDYITLNGVAYLNPIAKGWQQRYLFRLEDEVVLGRDTIYQLSYSPKPGSIFRALKGIVYINSDGYALSHFIGVAGDSVQHRSLRFEQVYQKTGDRWFPKELNYELVIKNFISPSATLQWTGHSVIDSVRFNHPFEFRTDKAHSTRLHDSVDLRSTGDWAQYRGDSITNREKMTYLFMDSFSKEYNLENIITATSKLAVGRMPIGKVDLEISRLAVQNAFEGFRPGVGFYTNDKISKYFSIGGWAGFGFKDKRWKGGSFLTLYPNGKKENWIQGSYVNQYQNPGDVRIHEELDKATLSNWVLQVPDRVEEYRLSGNLRAGYWELRAEGLQQTVQPLYTTLFQYGGKGYALFTVHEGVIGIRYAYGENRIPVFDHYLPGETKYPRVYLRLGSGRVAAPGYSANYVRLAGAITFQYKLNRWGRDALRLEGGIVKTTDNEPLPRSMLLAGNGINREGFNYYSPTGFITMRPYDYYSDQYASALYRHDFDRFFWDKKYSRPSLSLAHNVAIGRISNFSKESNAGIRSFGNGYHESGVLINSLLRVNIRLTDVYFNTGLFYHWSSAFDVKRNGTAVFSITTGF